MKDLKERTMRRIFKDFSINQLEELMKRLKEKIKKGGFDEIEDCELIVQAYAAVEELKDIKEKGPLFNWTDIEGYKHPKSNRTIFLDKNLIAHVGYYCEASNSWHCPDSGRHVPDDSVIAWIEYPEHHERRMCHD